jgi:release factor glutamine methyltransferase
MIYQPAEDSFLLEKSVKKYAKSKRVLDMGSGSGIQAQAALAVGASEVTAVDIDGEVIAHIKKQHIRTIKSDLFTNVKGTFDLIIFNPPYLPEDVREDKKSARITSGGKKGDEVLLRFFRQVLKHLASKGSILIVLSSLTPRKKLLDLIKKQDLSRKVIDKTSVFMETLEVWHLSRKAQ